ncbi:MAG TPA: sulfatase-like hydrolase/transferase [Candidatus Avidesulfovibrio excrementigallinarum]|nr:sulfatase-like hydrolase/transferase [Candidatus Avidesulfovibrio excrementigallinarum]
MSHNVRVRLLFRLCAVFLLINLIVRGGLMLAAGSASFDSWLDLPAMLLGGVANDLPVFVLMALPFALLLFMPRTSGPVWRMTCCTLFALYLAIFLFTAVAEALFWNEFASRFNFIAVDYLIYTTEVVRNIFESYPVIPLIASILAGAGLLSVLLLRPLQAALRGPSPSLRRGAAAWMILAALTWFYSPFAAGETNVYTREIASNGVWSLFSAYRNNQLDYRQFYPLMDRHEAMETLRRGLAAPEAQFVSDAPGEWRRWIEASRPERRLNVIQIVVESLGKGLLGPNTPYLNAVASRSLRFEGMLATGTRTVRGIEALTLAVPPTPGSSIVRRPGGSRQLFCTGSVFRQYGYDTSFIYGGYGYFDNMNAFFEGNGYRVVDRASIPDEEVTFSNAWGVCDEDLYRTVLREADAAYARNEPFYQFVLTTSNHRPYTYPEGKVSVPSGEGRHGAVQYTDYAIGEFLRMAAEKPWFDETVFVIVADHTNGSAGRTDLPVERYRIPCLIYSPANIAPGSINTLCSQIDVAPTLFDLLGFSYCSGFMGRSVLGMLPEEGRAWIATYQLLGRVSPDGFVMLEPLAAPVVEGATPPLREQLLKEAIAGYQTTQDLFVQGRLRERSVMAGLDSGKGGMPGAPAAPATAGLGLVALSQGQGR